jgi:hypothetical protein
MVRIAIPGTFTYVRVRTIVQYVRTYTRVRYQYHAYQVSYTCTQSCLEATSTGVPPRRRLPDPGVIQGIVTPRRRAQGGDTGSGSYPSVLQYYMLADIVGAIPAVDLAVEAVV